MVVSRGHVLGCVKKFRGFRIGWRSKQWELKERPTPFHHLRIGWWAGPVATPRPVVRADGGRAHVGRGSSSDLHPTRVRVVGGMPVAQLQAVRKCAVGAPPGARRVRPSPTRPACGRRRVASVESRAGNGSPCVRALNELRVAREGPVAELRPW